MMGATPADNTGTNDNGRAPVLDRPLLSEQDNRVAEMLFEGTTVAEICAVSGLSPSMVRYIRLGNRRPQIMAAVRRFCERFVNHDANSILYAKHMALDGLVRVLEATKPVWGAGSGQPEFVPDERLRLKAAEIILNYSVVYKR